MSVIAGILRTDGRTDGRTDAEPRCRDMLAALASYSAGELRTWAEDQVALGARLTARLPEDAFDAQPWRDDAAGVSLVADVRLDDRQALGDSLDIPAGELRNMSDAALVLRAWLRWGADAPERLHGDYALVVWEARPRRLHLVRSPGGLCPLHYHARPGFVAVASMPRGLHALEEVPYALDEDKLAGSLILSWTPDDASFFKGVSRVPPAHIVSFADGASTSRRFWRPEDIAPLRLRTPADYEAALREVFDAAVRTRLRGAPDVATQLSGGRDSPSVTATAARLLAPSGGRVAAFTSAPRAGYDSYADPRRFADESGHAAAVAAMHPNIDHTVLRSGAETPLDELDRAFDLYQRPAGDVPNMGWVHRIHAEAQARGLGVMLVGNYGNLTISYSGDFLPAELLRRGKLRALWRTNAALVRRGDSRKHVLAKTLGPWTPGPVWRLIARQRTGITPGIAAFAAINTDFLADLDRRQGSADRYPSRHFGPTGDSLWARMTPMIGADTGAIVKGAQAGWGVDIRDPTADQRVMEFCLSVPEEIYMQDGQRSSLLRRAFADRLPREILDEERRGYQSADWHEGLSAGRGALLAELARLEACDAAVRLLDLPRLRRLAEDWPTGDWHRQPVTLAYRTVLLRGVLTGHFARRVSEGRPGAGRPATEPQPRVGAAAS
jgi:asparagine synthase (glutamine-hydrolysing)